MAQYVYGKNVVMQMLKNQSEIQTLYLVSGTKNPEIEKEAQKFITGSIDGIYSFPHQFGCSQLGQDNENIKKLLSGVALNPNATFVLFVGLGCENNSIDKIKEYLASDQVKKAAAKAAA